MRETQIRQFVGQLFALRPPTRGGSIELGIWILLYTSIALPMALGESNGIGYFQQPHGHSLWAPLILGGAVNSWVIYLHAFRAMPQLLQKGARLRYFGALGAVIGVYLSAHLAYQYLLAWVAEPSLRKISIAQWTTENLKALPVVLVLSLFYKFGRDWTLHMSNHHALLQKTEQLEAEFRLVKEELASIQSGTTENWMLRVSSGRKQIQLPMQSIQYVKAAGNYVEIVTPENTHTVYGAISELERKLSDGIFVRVHRSFIVNLNHVTQIDQRSLQIGERKIPISATYKNALNDNWRMAKSLEDDGTNHIYQNQK